MIPSANQGVEDEPSKNISDWTHTYLTMASFVKTRQLQRSALHLHNHQGPPSTIASTLVKNLDNILLHFRLQRVALSGDTKKGIDMWQRLRFMMRIQNLITLRFTHVMFGVSFWMPLWTITLKDFVTQLHLLTSSIFNLSSLWNWRREFCIQILCEIQSTALISRIQLEPQITWSDSEEWACYFWKRRPKLCQIIPQCEVGRALWGESRMGWSLVCEKSDQSGSNRRNNYSPDGAVL